MIDVRQVEKLFPELNEIKDTKLRAQVAAVWVEAAKRGSWERIDDIPFTLLITDAKSSLVAHTRRVTQMALAVADVRRDLNRDAIVAGGLLHDVGKLLEIGKSAKGFGKSRSGELVRHPVSGYGLAVALGLPEEISHIIAAHSEEGDKTRRTPEAIVIHHCDFTDFEIAQR